MEKKKYFGIKFDFIELRTEDVMIESIPEPGEIGADGQDDYMYDW